MTGDIFLFKQDVSGREFCNPTTVARKNPGPLAAGKGNPSAAVRKSLPKQRKFRKKVENPDVAFGKSLPKQRKSAERVENPTAAVRKSLPKQRKISRKGRDSRVPTGPPNRAL